MPIQRVVPNLPTPNLAESVAFYTGLFRFEVAMDLGWIVTLASPIERVAQISLVRSEESVASASGISVSIEVSDVDAVYERVASRKLAIELPPTDEAWGVRRFQLRDPSGVLLNVLTHRSDLPSGE